MNVHFGLLRSNLLCLLVVSTTYVQMQHHWTCYVPIALDNTRSSNHIQWKVYVNTCKSALWMNEKLHRCLILKVLHSLFQRRQTTRGEECQMLLQTKSEPLLTMGERCPTGPWLQGSNPHPHVSCWASGRSFLLSSLLNLFQNHIGEDAR